MSDLFTSEKTERKIEDQNASVRWKANERRKGTHRTENAQKGGDQGDDEAGAK